MSQVDILRFVANVQQLFAPSIHEGQTFIAYLDEEDNSYTVQGDNLSFEGSGSLGGTIDKLQQNLDALQSVVNALQPVVDGLADSSEIYIVDDIVYGYDDSSLNPETLSVIKGRPLLTFGGYSFALTVDNHLASNWDSKVYLPQEITAGSLFAGFGDGKIHTINDPYDDSGITSKTLSDGVFIFNKADGYIYVYDADNHSFNRFERKQHFTVDYIIDYIGYELPSTFTANEAMFFQLNQEGIGGEISRGCKHESGDSFSFANIQSILSGEAEIYTVENYSYSDETIRAIYDLHDGDTIYCKSNSCSYTFVNNNGVKSFEALEQSGTGSSIAVVDDIIWGVYDASAQNPSFPINFKAMRGRPYLHVDNSNYSYPIFAVVNFFSSGELLGVSYIEEIDGAKSYAAFYDGKIYEAEYGSITSSKTLSNGDFIFCKADNSLYTYDAQNHKFIKEGKNHHYVVDLIINYVSATPTRDIPDNLPNSLSQEGALILHPVAQADNHFYELHPYYRYFNAFMDGWYFADVALDEGICFANILSGFNDEACIYKNTAVGGGDTAIRVIHELREGDTFYNNMDGCTYMLSTNGNSKSFLRISEPVIPPVQDILHIGADMPDSPSAEGDKYLSYAPDESNFSGYLFTAPSDSDWGYGTQINDGKFYASLDNHKLYSFNGWGGKVFMPVPIPVGVPFLNKADNCLYVFDGSAFVKTSNS